MIYDNKLALVSAVCIRDSPENLSEDKLLLLWKSGWGWSPGCLSVHLTSSQSPELPVLLPVWWHKKSEEMTRLVPGDPSV